MFGGGAGGVAVPDEVDDQGGLWIGEAQEGDAAWELIDQRADDERDAAALSDVAPDGRPGSVFVERGLEPGVAADGKDGVVVARCHLAGPKLKQLASELREMEPVVVDKAMVGADGADERFAAEFLALIIA
jgi:hypothetical protein